MDVWRLNDTNDYLLERSFDAESWYFKDGVKDGSQLVSLYLSDQQSRC